MRQHLLENHWLQIEQASRGCVSGNSDECPVLVNAIERLTGEPMGRRSADWLQGFCSAAMLLHSKGTPINERLRRLSYRMTFMCLELDEGVATEESKQHAKELAGAAQTVWQWSKHVK